MGHKTVRVEATCSRLLRLRPMLRAFHIPVYLLLHVRLSSRELLSHTVLNWNVQAARYDTLALSASITASHVARSHEFLTTWICHAIRNENGVFCSGGHRLYRFDAVLEPGQVWHYASDFIWWRWHRVSLLDFYATLQFFHLPWLDALRRLRFPQLELCPVRR